ncbi:secreted RxLR effector protein 78-like [Juglans regia]|uniref:Secreted RxLR effector protein 78-like n=1 Tax=Juglans regia TaxID=51240 RepID=A0A6P9EQI0_JUGRE|nr:secreted RxLR effector protein 78-like [Juglans regia]
MVKGILTEEGRMVTEHEEIEQVMANKLKKLFPYLISSNKSAFISRRLITDNVMIVYETLHTMKTRQKGRVGSIALKLDMAKAYDRIEWKLLEGMMRRLGFGERWIGLIMQCLNSISYSILLNGEPGRVIKPTRGIRQGDLISPYLFILCAEGLSSLINMAERSKKIRGVVVAGMEQG